MQRRAFATSRVELPDATYLPSYFIRLHEVSRGTPYYAELKRNLFFAILRVILHVAAAVAVVQHAERVMSWLVSEPGGGEKKLGLSPLVF